MGTSLDGLVDELRDAARELDAAVSRARISGRFTSTYRSRSEQERLYRSYLAGRNPFPVAPPGFSPHEYGEAFDYVVSPAIYQADVGATWVDWGGEWGGTEDMVHFELPGASARAAARGRDGASDVPWYVNIASSLPFGLGTSLLFDFLGVPTAARKDVTPEQLTILQGIARQQGFKQ